MSRPWRTPSVLLSHLGRPVMRLTCLLLLAVFCLSLAAAPSPTFPPSVGSEPITPIPPPPAQDLRRIALGEQLFNDPRLSHDSERSCSSCHDLRTNGASANARDLTPDGRLTSFNTLTVFN